MQQVHKEQIYQTVKFVVKKVSLQKHSLTNSMFTSQIMQDSGTLCQLHIAIHVVWQLKQQESCAIVKMSVRYTIQQYAYGLKLESPFVPSSTDCWAVQAKIRQNGRLDGRRGETGSRNMAVTQKIERALVTSYRPSIVTFLYLNAFQRYCRFCVPARHFFPPFPSLPKISPCSPGSSSFDAHFCVFLIHLLHHTTYAASYTFICYQTFIL